MLIDYQPTCHYRFNFFTLFPETEKNQPLRRQQPAANCSGCGDRWRHRRRCRTSLPDVMGGRMPHTAPPVNMGLAIKTWHQWCRRAHLPEARWIVVGNFYFTSDAEPKKPQLHIAHEKKQSTNAPQPHLPSTSTTTLHTPSRSKVDCCW